MKKPSYPHTDGLAFGPSPRTQKALESAFESIAKFLGREDEYKAFIKIRDMTLTGMNDPKAIQVAYEEYKRNIPLWVTALEKPLYELYEAGIEEGCFLRMNPMENPIKKQRQKRVRSSGRKKKN